MPSSERLASEPCQGTVKAIKMRPRAFYAISRFRQYLPTVPLQDSVASDLQPPLTLTFHVKGWPFHEQDSHFQQQDTLQVGKLCLAIAGHADLSSPDNAGI